MASQLELVSENRCFGGRQLRYRHRSQVLDCDMVFAVFLPPQAEQRPVPALWWLSGLTCTDENFITKAGAQRLAAELGLAIICPDTSPRGTDLPGEHDSYDFGSGAGFYVNATQTPWNRHYQMYDYVTRELPELVRATCPVSEREAICGHSMGGHGALVAALRQPGRYASVSAFAPISSPMHCDWGTKALSGYLGQDRETWQQYDACALIQSGSSRQPLFVDQGMADPFIEALQPERLRETCRQAGHPLELRLHEHYDHSYYFIATFIDDHLRYHARHLGLIPDTDLLSL